MKVFNLQDLTLHKVFTYCANYSYIATRLLTHLSLPCFVTLGLDLAVGYISPVSWLDVKLVNREGTGGRLQGWSIKKELFFLFAVYGFSPQGQAGWHMGVPALFTLPAGACCSVQWWGSLQLRFLITTGWLLLEFTSREPVGSGQHVLEAAMSSLQRCESQPCGDLL